MQNTVLLEIFKNVIKDNLPKIESAVTTGSADDLKSIGPVVQAIRSAAKVVAVTRIVDLCKSLEGFIARSVEAGTGLNELERNFFSTVAEL